jgi:hypothetical protein
MFGEYLLRKQEQLVHKEDEKKEKKGHEKREKRIRNDIPEYSPG